MFNEQPLATYSTIGNYNIDTLTQTVTRTTDQQSIKLSKSEVLIVALLSSNHGVTICREHLLECCWPGKVVTHSSLTVAIKNIRNAFAVIGEDNIIVTEPKKGYSIRLQENDAQLHTLKLSSNGIGPLPETVLPLNIEQTAHFTEHEKINVKSTTLIFVKNHFVSVVFFLLTLVVFSKYFLFVEHTSVNGISTLYDGVDIPERISLSVNSIPSDMSELIVYPLGGLCSSFQIIGFNDMSIVDFTAKIDQGDCNNE
ncbi:winged helix-turn-helix domain-containing protein [Photobacterium indicum]|uniref:Helix-turn-helix domain-containing protein n=1 Tax=Photobacterium indicum TaxID=81447 RepID=A0A2T3L2S0_9GAMM|nr:helix-turn-helix domain-containing protein [Photobacterium indicum]PSV43172.1 helix-turn-helix domain-containing protein [Photobacterium indicum]